MEFVSDSEYITTLLLIPVFSAGIFLTISFLEILDKHGEILFISKTHNYSNKDFIFPFILAVLVGLFFYGFYFHAEDYFNSFPPTTPDPCVLDPVCRMELDKGMTVFSLIDKYVKPLFNEWGFS